MSRPALKFFYTFSIREGLAIKIFTILFTEFNKGLLGKKGRVFISFR